MQDGSKCLPNVPIPHPISYPKNLHYLTPGCEHPFAEPTVVINGHIYAAASLRQASAYTLRTAT